MALRPLTAFSLTPPNSEFCIGWVAGVWIAKPIRLGGWGLDREADSNPGLGVADS